MSYYYDYQIRAAPEPPRSQNYYSVNPTLSYYPMTSQKDYEPKAYHSISAKLEGVRSTPSLLNGTLPYRTKNLEHQFIELKERLSQLAIGRNEQLAYFEKVIEELDCTMKEIEGCRQRLLNKEDYSLEQIFKRITPEKWAVSKDLQRVFRDLFGYEYKLCELNLFFTEEFKEHRMSYEQFCCFFKGIKKHVAEELSEETFHLAMRIVSMKIQLYSNLEYHRQNLQEKGMHLDRVFNYLDKDYDGKLGPHDLKQFELIGGDKPRIGVQDFTAFFRPKSQADFTQIHE